MTAMPPMSICDASALVPARKSSIAVLSPRLYFSFIRFLAFFTEVFRFKLVGAIEADLPRLFLNTYWVSSFAVQIPSPVLATKIPCNPVMSQHSWNLMKAQRTSFFQNPKNLAYPRKSPPIALRLLGRNASEEISSGKFQHDDMERHHTLTLTTRLPDCLADFGTRSGLRRCLARGVHRSP